MAHILAVQVLSNCFQPFRLEALNEKRSGVVQMVKLAEKEREGLEVRFYSNLRILYFFRICT